PVHGDDVLIAVEEVVAHERNVRMGRDGEEHARFSEQHLPVDPGTGGADLEGDGASVLMVKRLDDTALASVSDHLDQLVPFPQELSHRVPRSRDEDRTGPYARCVDASLEVWSLSGRAQIQLGDDR